MIATPNGRPCAMRFSSVVSRMSATWASRTSPSGNSSPMTATVAPAAFAMPSARWPADRPIATTKYHRLVVIASVIRLLTSAVPTWRAVWNPNVGMPAGSGRSLSIVFGTCATWSAAPRGAGGTGDLRRAEGGVVPADRDQRVDASDR